MDGPVAPKDTRPQHDGTFNKAAGGRPIGVGPVFCDVAARLLDNGFDPLPIRPGSKVPAVSRWSAIPIDDRQVTDWSARFPDHGIGLRTGILVGLDIDILDPDLAQQIHALATARLGDTLLRVGRWPKRLLLYRTDAPFAKVAIPGIEVLGAGQQFVAFGIHPDTGKPYYWPDGETPLEMALDDLPRVDRDAIGAFLAEASAFLPDRPPTQPRSPVDRQIPPTRNVVRDDVGLVVDGRDSWLSMIAYHVIWDAHDASEALDTDMLTARTWDRFASSADIARPRKNGSQGYGPADARRKVADKLRLLHDGHLAPRAAEPVEPAPAQSTQPVEAARAVLETAIDEACGAIVRWHEETTGLPAPQIGIRATVGLGKSTLARTHLLLLRERLADSGGPGRIAIFTPSHALAEEAAERWREDGVHAAVLHGYEAKQPVSGVPFCQDIEAVRLAIEAGAPVHQTVCNDGRAHHCPFHGTCLKQVNRREIAGADVIVAAYDALWSGFAIETSSLAAIVIDEACWPRAATETRCLSVETFRSIGLVLRRPGRRSELAMADLDDLRQRAVAAFASMGPGAVTRQALAAHGLGASDCRQAVRVELDRLQDLPLTPGASPNRRPAAAAVARHNTTVRACADLWTTLANFLEGTQDICGRVVIEEPDPEAGVHRIVVRGVRSIHPTLRDIPILHLDATLRRELALTILPRLQNTVIEADAPHMTLRLVTGGFGKTAIVQDPRAQPEENLRRDRKLAGVVSYVAWEAARARPGRTLVITYKDCEHAFQHLSGVQTAHFNAIAGLDAWKDVALLIVVGRPLPSDAALVPLAGAYFGHVPVGGYAQVRRGIRMQGGSVRTVSMTAHDDPLAESLRAAICDDELIQAIGRGRAVNRTTANPLEVQVLSDVALPLVHDSLAPWEMVAPDVLQQMLLAGIAVNSPADAVALHPDLFAGEEQAKKAFQRSVFKGQIPIKNTYRDLSLKSAAYRRPGRGRGWQTAYWLEGDDKAAHGTLTRCLGALAGWVPASA